MRLITHNMLKCSVRGVEKGYPLKITAETVENVPAEFNAVVCAKMADRINWEALRSACKDLNLHDLDEVHDFTSAGYTSTSSSSAATPAVTTAEGESDGHVFQAVNVAATVAPVVVQEADLKALHHVLFEIHVLEGELVCPESGRRFFVRDGIPNMLLHEDELGTGPEPVVPESKSEDSAAVVSSSSS